MGFGNATMQKAVAVRMAEIKKRRDEYEEKLAKAHKSFPELEKTERELMSLGAQSVRAAMSGDKAELKLIKEKSTALSEKKAEILKAAGIKELKPLCKKCGDTLRVNGEYCDCVKDIAKKTEIESMAEKMPLDKCTFSSFDVTLYPEDCRKKMQNIYNFCKKYADNFSLKSENLLFIGAPGLGKTHLSLSVVNECVLKGFRVIYGSAQNIFSAVENEHFSFSGSEEKLDALLTCDLLVIDDLGTEFTSQFISNVFYNIINTRINCSKPTIINTNLSFDELEKKYTARITSRFIGEYELKGFCGNDIRQILRMKKCGK